MGRTWNPNFSVRGQEFQSVFYNQQALAILHGRLDVPGVGFQSTECFIISGKCFGYFGLTPSILRFPVIAIGGDGAPSLTPLFIAIAIAIAMWALVDLFQRVLIDLIPEDSTRRVPGSVATIVVVLLLGPGSILTFLTKPTLYHEAIVWMIAFLLVAMNFVHRWVMTPRNIYLGIAAVAAILSAGARQSSVPAAAVLGIGAGIVLFRDRYRRSPSRSELTLASLLAIGPGFVSSAILWLKFGSPTLPFKYYNSYQSEQFQRILALNDGNIVSLRFLPTALANYLRPDSLGYSLTSPWVKEQLPLVRGPNYLWPIQPGGLYVEPFVSLTNSMTIPLLFTVGLIGLKLFRGIDMSSQERRSSTILLLAAASCSIAPLMLWGLSARYNGDFYPLMVIGTIFAMAHGTRWLMQRGVAFVIVAGVLGLLAVGSFYSHLQLTST
ncbi:MAG: hypothetical protein WCJ88_12360 [Actinomycetes bacterium]